MKKEKIEIRESIEFFDNFLNDGGSLKNLIKMLQEIEEKHNKKYKEIFVCIQDKHCYNSHGDEYSTLDDYEIAGMRDETDDEYNERIKIIEENEKQFHLQEEQKRKEELERKRKIYLQLKEELGE